MENGKTPRRLPVGAETTTAGGVHFRVWAPRRQRVEVVFEGGVTGTVLTAEGNGYFAGDVGRRRPGALYRFRLDGDPTPYPDPASRFQPEGPHGPSQVVDPSAFAWTDQDWRGAGLQGPGDLRDARRHVHAGRDLGAAARELPELADLGMTVLEVMPVADFPGRFGWGYDGVNLFAPTPALRPARRLPPLRRSGPRRRPRRHSRRGLQPPRARRQLPRSVRPGLFQPPSTRPIGARRSTSTAPTPARCASSSSPTPATGSTSSTSTACASTRRSRSSTPRPTTSWRPSAARVREAARGRATLIVAENEPQHVRLVRPLDKGGYGLDALWNDDFHHSADGRPDRPQRGLLHRLSRQRRRSSSRR